MSDEIARGVFSSFDGVRLSWRELGSGRNLVLLHGFFSDAVTNWIRYGHAAQIAAGGFRVIMPDLRGHGDSARPHDPECYPRDALARDGAALIAHLGLGDYDLGGYSLGARTVVRMVVAGATPRRLVVAGMGLEGLVSTGARAAHFRGILTRPGAFPRGSPEWLAQAFLKTTGGDPAALLQVLDTFVDTGTADIAAIEQRVLVVSGIDDDDNGSAQALNRLLPHGQYVSIPGGHMSAIVDPALGQSIAAFLVA